MKKRFLYLILPLITLILEILPYGAVLNYALPATDGSIGHFRDLYSYFDLTPFGYANFAPLITAVISCLVFVLVMIYFITGNARVAVKAKNILYVAAVISLGPLIFGIRYFSLVGGCITITLIAELLLLQFVVKKPTK